MENTTPKIKNHTKQCGNKEKRKCGNGADEKWCGDGVVEMVRARRERKIDGLYRNATK